MKKSILSLNPFYSPPGFKEEYFQVLLKLNINSEMMLYREVKYGKKIFFKSGR